MANNNGRGKSLESWIWDAACSIRGAKKENPGLQGIIDRVDFNATTHGQRDIDDDRLSNLTSRGGCSDSPDRLKGLSRELGKP